MTRYVLLIQDDKDEYDGIGVGIYPTSEALVALKSGYEANTDDDGAYEKEVDRIRLEGEVIERVYGPSETAAWSNAHLRCEEEGWVVV